MQLLTQNIWRSLRGHLNTSQGTIWNDIRNSHLSYSQDFSQELKNIRIENPAFAALAYLNINSIRNRFNSLQELIKGNIDVVISTLQFLFENYHQPFRLDLNTKIGGILVYANSGVAVNSGLGGGGSRFKSGAFLYCKYGRGIKESIMFLHRLNNIEHNFFRIVYAFPKNRCRKLLKKEPRGWKYIISFYWTIGWLDIQKFSRSKCYFQER